MSQNELKPCRKCGELDYEFLEGKGTQADLVCNNCGMEETVQVCDVFDYGDPRRHAPFIDKEYNNSKEIIDAVNEFLIREWNTRAIIPEAKELLERIEEWLQLSFPAVNLFNDDAINLGKGANLLKDCKAFIEQFPIGSNLNTTEPILNEWQPLPEAPKQGLTTNKE